MNNDRQITITTGASRKSTTWLPQTMQLSALYDRLRTPARGKETLAEYLALPKARQDELKDVGGFVAGTISGSRRKAGNVTGRDLLTLDIDNIPPGGTNAVLDSLDGLGVGFCVYSTRKHDKTRPRLRVLLPLDRTCSADEYEPCARRVAGWIGMELMDPTTFEASRLMYWPSCCADSEYVYRAADLPPISVSGLLASYEDWHDFTQWPIHASAPSPKRAALKQGDPLERPGIVGAFCNCYDIPEAMDHFLPGIYAQVEGTPDRYTFVGGSTVGGAVLYEGGKFLFSHHATDPCSGKLVNAFDLVRTHLYEDLDESAAPGTPGNRLPSFQAMCELAAKDPTIAAYQLRAGMETAAAEQPEAETDWLKQLKVSSKTGLPLQTIDNVLIILENDPQLKGRFALNEFTGRGEVLGDLPWSTRSTRRAWSDSDNSGLYWYLEKIYKIGATGKIDAALDLHSVQHAFNDVTDYLNGLTWDGVPRLDKLFIDYLGAEDNTYTRTVTHKAFVAAVARALRPGTKFDCMTILSGPQGLGKSTLLATMSRGWFNDSIRTFEGKEASELLQGVWLVEVAELDAFRNSDVARIKQFLSQCADRFRAAYGRHVKEIPRRCVFFSTTNVDDYLRDTTGNRRFWPVDVGRHPAVKDVWEDLPKEVDQLWAEAVAYWRIGETLFLTGDVEKLAIAQQEGHREVSAREGMIRDFLEREVPADWNSWSIDRRRIFWNSENTGDTELVPRDRVCAQEVWCELFGGRAVDMRQLDTREINGIIASDRSWQRAGRGTRFGPYGKQRGWSRG